MFIMNSDFLSDCPLGYKQIDGYIEIRELESKVGISLHQCANECNAMNECHLFAHSVNDKTCKLIDDIQPTAGKYKDYKLCREDTGNLTIKDNSTRRVESKLVFYILLHRTDISPKCCLQKHAKNLS